MNIDTARIHAKCGKGGNGCISFRREKFVPRDGPNGGGGGGRVILEAAEGMGTLIGLKHNPLQVADDGKHGMAKEMHGADEANEFCKPHRKFDQTCVLIIILESAIQTLMKVDRYRHHLTGI